MHIIFYCISFRDAQILVLIFEFFLVLIFRDPQTQGPSERVGDFLVLIFEFFSNIKTSIILVLIFFSPKIFHTKNMRGDNMTSPK